MYHSVPGLPGSSTGDEILERRLQEAKARSTALRRDIRRARIVSQSKRLQADQDELMHRLQLRLAAHPPAPPAAVRAEHTMMRTLDSIVRRLDGLTTTQQMQMQQQQNFSPSRPVGDRSRGNFQRARSMAAAGEGGSLEALEDGGVDDDPQGGSGQGRSTATGRRSTGAGGGGGQQRRSTAGGSKAPMPDERTLEGWSLEDVMQADMSMFDVSDDEDNGGDDGRPDGGGGKGRRRKPSLSATRKTALQQFSRIMPRWRHAQAGRDNPKPEDVLKGKALFRAVAWHCVLVFRLQIILLDFAAKTTRERRGQTMFSLKAFFDTARSFAARTV